MFLVLLTPGATLRATFPDGTRVCIERGDGTPPTAAVTLLVTLLSDDVRSDLWHALGGTSECLFFTMPCAAIMECTSMLTIVATLACEPPTVLVPVDDGCCLQGILTDNNFIRLDKLLRGAADTVFPVQEVVDPGEYTDEDVCEPYKARYEAWLTALKKIGNTLPPISASLTGHAQAFAENIRERITLPIVVDARSAISPLTTLADAVSVATLCECFDAARELAHILAAHGELDAEPLLEPDHEVLLIFPLYNMLKIRENLFW
jgi:hypothetical protein